MQNLTFNKKITIALISVILLISIGVCFFLTPHETAYADTSDYSVVNFNQLIQVSHSAYNNYGLTLSISNNEIHLNGTPQFQLTFDVGTINLISGHYYYYFSDNDYVYFNVVDNFLFNQQPYIVQAVNSGSYGTQIKVQVYDFNNDIVHLNFIDLTQMFGSDVANTITLSQCQELFVADYYSYTPSQNVIVYENGYYQGYLDGLADGDYNYTIDVSSSSLAMSSLTYNGTTYSSATSITSDGITDCKVYNSAFSGSDVYNYSCCCYLDFPYTASLGSSIQISYTTFGQMVNTSEGFLRDILFIAKDRSGSLYNIFTINSYNYVYDDSYVYSLVLPISVEGIYICTNLSNFFFNNLEISYNIDSETAYLSAYNAAMDTIKSTYQEGGNAYNEIYYAGKQAGVESANSYSFRGLITAVIDTPINAVLNMLDFDILGVNMKGFYLSLFTFAIILMVIKLVL